MRNIKQKVIVCSISILLFFALLMVSAAQWMGVDVFEASGIRNGWWIGPVFNYLRGALGNEVSAILTLALSALPLWVAIQYWRGRIN